MIPINGASLLELLDSVAFQPSKTFPAWFTITQTSAQFLPCIVHRQALARADGAKWGC